jgi:hypothetical protein
VYDHAGTYNGATDAGTMWVERSSSQTSGYTYSQSVQFTFGLHYDLEISAQVAGMGPKMTAGWKWEVQTENKKEWSKTETYGLTFKVAQPTAPGKTTMCVGYTQSGTFDGNYEANVHITLKNGREFEFRERGTRNSVIFGGSETRCADKEGDHMSEDPQSFVESNPTISANTEKRDLAKLIGTPFTA